MIIDMTTVHCRSSGTILVGRVVNIQMRLRILTQTS